MPAQNGRRFAEVIFKCIVFNGVFCNFERNVVEMYVLKCLIDDELTLFQVMAWWYHKQAITLNNIDPDSWRHMASLGLNVSLSASITLEP